MPSGARKKCKIGVFKHEEICLLQNERGAAAKKNSIFIIDVLKKIKNIRDGRVGSRRYFLHNN